MSFNKTFSQPTKLLRLSRALSSIFLRIILGPKPYAFTSVPTVGSKYLSDFSHTSLDLLNTFIKCSSTGVLIFSFTLLIIELSMYVDIELLITSNIESILFDKLNFSSLVSSKILYVVPRAFPFILIVLFSVKQLRKSRENNINLIFFE